jgi:hypothetical protein
LVSSVTYSMRSSRRSWCQLHSSSSLKCSIAR